MNILAIGSHPDDIEFLCAGTLLKCKKRGDTIYLALTTSGNIGSNVLSSREEIAETREKEQLAAAEYFGAKTRFLRYDDEGLLDSQKVRKEIIETIRWANPDIIFTNYPGDMSTDHSTTAEIVGRVMLSLPGKNVPSDEPPIEKSPSLFYWDTAAGIDFHPEVYIDITAEWDEKMIALACHKSQYAWMDTFQLHGFTDHCRILGEFRGLQNGCKYAEGFRAYRIHGFMPDFSLLPF